MVYVALLRGINVGGNSIVPMARLKTVFESIGLDRVQTYINSGNVIFSSRSASAPVLTRRIESAIKRDVGLPLRVLLRDLRQMKQLVAGIPKNWVNDGQTKCEVMFLWDEVDRATVVKELPVNREIEDVKYVKGAVRWCIDRKLASRSRMARIVGTGFYKNITIRNPTTVRKLYQLMLALDAAV